MTGPARLFVYGSLRSDVSAGPPGAGEARALLVRGGVLEGKASVSGCLHDLGGYPGFVPGGRGRVTGQVWRLRDPRLFVRLDAYEGDPYVREAVRVRMDDGGHVTAALYRYRLAVAGIPRIASGDYLEWVRSHS